LNTNEETPTHQCKHNLIELNKEQYNILQKLFYNDWAKKRQRQGYTIPNKIQTILKKWYQEGVECSGKKWSSEKAQHVLQEGPMCFDWHAKLVVTVEKIKKYFSSKCKIAEDNIQVCNITNLHINMTEVKIFVEQNSISCKKIVPNSNMSQHTITHPLTSPSTNIPATQNSLHLQLQHMPAHLPCTQQHQATRPHTYPSPHIRAHPPPLSNPPCTNRKHYPASKKQTQK
jgi:hypothetical protein